MQTALKPPAGNKIPYPFIPYPKSALRPAWEGPKLTGGARKVMDSLVALTAGTGRSVVTTPISKIASWAGVGNSTVTRSLPSLIEAKLIAADLVPTGSGRKIYRLQVLSMKPHVILTCQNDAHDLRHDKKDDLHHQRDDLATGSDDASSRSITTDPVTPPADPTPENTMPPAPTEEKVPPGEPEAPRLAAPPPLPPPPKPEKKPAREGPSLTEQQAALASRLRHCAVSHRQAEQLVLNHPADVVEKALLGIVTRKDVINPAGWIVREVQAGGYSAPEGLRAAQNREAVARVRQAERDSEKAEREQREAAARPQFDQIAALPAEERAALLRLAREKVRRFSLGAAAGPEDSPILRAAMVDLLQERQGCKAIPAGFVASRPGWGELRRINRIDNGKESPG